MRPSTLLVLGWIGLCLGTCTPAVPAPGTPQPFSFACEKPNEGQLIAVEGYLRLPASLDSARNVMLRLYPDPSFQGSPLGVLMQFGDGANEAHKISSSYRDQDLKVRLADGTVVPFGQRVRVSGRMYLPVQAQDYPCALQNPYVEIAK
jgi:hypothetical protein